MSTTFCTQCGAPLEGPFCSACGAAASPVVSIAKGVAATDETLVQARPQLPPFTQPPMGLPPLYVPLPAVAPPQTKQKLTPLLWALAAVLALVAGAVTAVLVLKGSSSTPSAFSSTPSASTTFSASPVPTSTAPTYDSTPSAPVEPGIRSDLVPSWANPNIGRLVTAQIVLGAGGTAVFATQGHNTCGVVDAQVTCVATPSWLSNNPATLPAQDPTCSSTPDGRWAVFTLGATAGTAAICTSTPAALTLGAGTAPRNQVIGMGSTGTLCLIDVRPGVPASQTGVACWNPATNHGFMITHQDRRLW